MSDIFSHTVLCSPAIAFLGIQVTCGVGQEFPSQTSLLQTFLVSRKISPTSHTHTLFTFETLISPGASVDQELARTTHSSPNIPTWWRRGGWRRQPARCAEGKEMKSNHWQERTTKPKLRWKTPWKWVEVLTEEGQGPMICILEPCIRFSCRHGPCFGQSMQAGMPIASSQATCRSLCRPKSFGQDTLCQSHLTKVGSSPPAQSQGWSRPLAELLVGWRAVPRGWLEINQRCIRVGFLEGGAITPCWVRITAFRLPWTCFWCNGRFGFHHNSWVDMSQAARMHLADRNGALGLVLPKCNCFVPKTGLRPAKGAACRHSSFLQPTALRASLPTGTFSTYKQLLLFPVFPGHMKIFLHILRGHKHTVYVAGLINKEYLLSFPSDHSHRDTRRSQVQSVEAFT